MNQLLRSISAALDVLFKRAAERRAGVTQIMRDALAARAAALGPAPIVPTATRPRRPGADSTPGHSATLAPRSVAAPTVANLVRPMSDGPSRTEAGMVRGIFSNPQSLAAAFIAAEILAPPPALRDR